MTITIEQAFSRREISMTNQVAIELSRAYQNVEKAESALADIFATSPLPKPAFRDVAERTLEATEKAKAEIRLAQRIWDERREVGM